MPHRLQQYLAKKPGRAAGITSVCSAHPWVIRAAAEQAHEDQSLLLVEATSNQVNQFGGYTGMRPAEFRTFVEAIVQQAGLSLDKLILGGDHLGPNPWRHLDADQAMAHAEVMVAEYVRAGFTKIHLDASMSCAGDPPVLADEDVAARAVRLAQAAEANRHEAEAPVYVLGTEVPTPGGATHALGHLAVTTPAAAQHTWDVHKAAFEDAGLFEVWPRVLALVVQPGVEFGHDSVVDYDRRGAAPLVAWLQQENGPPTFEAHSTDYQLDHAYPALVEDGFGILKVGPALTFALREALFALEGIEASLVEEGQRSHLAATVEAQMLAKPKDWEGHYHGNAAQLRLLRIYSYSDRVRYYWHVPEIAASVETLLRNLADHGIPESILSQYLPVQYVRVREAAIKNEPIALIVDKVRDVLRVYARACRPL